MDSEETGNALVGDVTLSSSTPSANRDNVLGFQQSTLSELAHLLTDPSRLSIVKDSEVGCGGYGDVYLATLDGTLKVAVKQLRIVLARGTRVRVAMRLTRELKIWEKAKHPNILKLTGYYLNENYSCAQLISPYMENGNITEYIKRTQASIDVKLGFVRDITSGMAYLHSCDPPICHGDLKPANVLINNMFDAVLCDFGLAAFVEDPETPSGLTTSRSVKGSTRYMSPELFQDVDAKHTLESDIWAWACTVFEVVPGAYRLWPSVDTRGFCYRLLRALFHMHRPGAMEAL
ncbi:hypothetical protein FS837_012292 [Tulasnella sp. UAMH 9824]|nr:hypothetical protein FS837_012292 [Tulasnella sp. UAMH 9824]